MRKRNRYEQKIAKTQEQIEKVNKEIAYNEAEIARLQKEIADTEAMIAITHNISGQVSNYSDILQKEKDGIPLLPHEEAILKSLMTTFSVHAPMHNL